MESDNRQAVSPVYLVGMPGVGKSYWARQLCRAYNWSLIDMDDRLEQQEGMPVSAIFAQYGEATFRQMEQDMLAEIAGNNIPVVVACGGGTPCYANNMELMLQTGTVIYLKATVATLLDHLQYEVHLRPMLADKNDVAAFLEELMKERSPIYEKAHHIVHTENISLTTFTQILSHV